MRRTLSQIRSAVGKKGAKARWAGRTDKATACLRVYPADADEIKRRARIGKRLPADVVAEIVAATR